MDINNITNNENKEIDECHICLELLEGEVVELSCSHIFHYDCIKNWIKKNKKNNKVCCICEIDTEIINIFYNMSQPIKNIPTQNDISYNNYKTTNLYLQSPDLYEQQPSNRVIIEQEIMESNLWTCCNIL
jgi:hypothetical protein